MKLDLVKLNFMLIMDGLTQIVMSLTHFRYNSYKCFMLYCFDNHSEGTMCSEPSSMQ